MGRILNYKVLAIVELVFAVIGIANAVNSQSIYALSHWEQLLPQSVNLFARIEMILNGILGITGAVLLWKRNKKGITVSRIWSFLQIPIIVEISESSFPIIFVFSQFFTFNYSHSSASTSNILLGPVQLYSLTLIGVNFVGVVLFLLFWKIRFPKK